MKNLLRCTLLFILITPATTFGGFQFSFLGGLDRNDDGGNGVIARFQLITKPGFLRAKSAFTVLNGGGVQQGEFSLGTMLYFLSPLFKESPAQPFVEGEGIFGVGAADSSARMDFGFAVGGGVDLRFFTKGGFTLGAQMKSAAETSYRFWLGYYYFRF